MKKSLYHCPHVELPDKYFACCEGVELEDTLNDSEVLASTLWMAELIKEAETGAGVTTIKFPTML